jgi:GNAT superfamily N-acetyltransferase
MKYRRLRDSTEVVVRPLMQVSVRQATVDDADAACACLRRSIVECCTLDHRGDRAILDAWLRNKTPANLREWFSAPLAYAVVAELAGEIQGVAMLGGNGTVALCYLLPEARFHGTGRAMLAALEQEAKRRGLSEIVLYSTRTAHEFYLRNGYADTGVEVEAFGLQSPEMRKVICIRSNKIEDDPGD